MLTNIAIEAIAPPPVILIRENRIVVEKVVERDGPLKSKVTTNPKNFVKIQAGSNSVKNFIFWSGSIPKFFSILPEMASHWRRIAEGRYELRNQRLNIVVHG